MQVVKGIRISLTIGDIVDNIAVLTKQQIIQKVRILLDRKQVQINQKIEKNNAQHLLVLQKKMLILEKKDEQIFKLNNNIATYKNQLHDQRVKIGDLADELMDYKLKCDHFQKKYNESDNIFKEEKSKRQKLKKQHEKLLADYKVLNQNYNNQVRNYKKIKEEKVAWHEQTQMLINKQIKINQINLQNEISNITMQNENRIAFLNQKIEQLNKQMKVYKDKYIQAKVNIVSLNKLVQSITKELNLQKSKQKKIVKLQVSCQTDKQLIEQSFLKGQLFTKQFISTHILKEINIFKIGSPVQKNVVKHLDQQSQTQIQQCNNCINYKISIQTLENQVKNLKPKQSRVVKTRKNNAGVQTVAPLILQKSQCESQTIFQSLKRQDQQFIISAFRQIKTQSSMIIQGLQKKYEQLEAIFLQRPSKLTDRKKINELQHSLLQKQLNNIKNIKTIQNLNMLNNQLFYKINQQQATLRQIKNYDLQISSNSINSQSQVVNNVNKLNVSVFKVDIEQKVNPNYSFSISVRQNKLKSRSLSPRILNENRKINLNSSTVSKLHLNVSPTLKISKETQANLEKFKGQLLQKGIVFRSKQKVQKNQGVSQIRSYKKYKGSLKKVKL